MENSIGKRILIGASLVWGVGLFLFFTWGLPSVLWSLAGALGFHWLVMVPVIGCVYLLYRLDDSLNSPRARWIVAKLENPFTRNPDGKAGVVLVLMPMLTAGVLLGTLFVDVTIGLDVIAQSWPWSG